MASHTKRLWKRVVASAFGFVLASGLVPSAAGAQGAADALAPDVLRRTRAHLDKLEAEQRVRKSGERYTRV